MSAHHSPTNDTRPVSAKIWKQLIVPVRAEIIEVMRTVETATIKEVASVLSRVPASLYAHFDRLVTLGVLVDKEPRRLTRHTERVFALAARDFVPDFDPADNKAVGEIATTTATGITRSALRTLGRAARAGRLRVTGTDPNHGSMHEVVWLDEHELTELRTALRELKRLSGTRKTPDGRQPHLLVAMYMPIVGSARQRLHPTVRAKAARTRNSPAPRTRRTRPHAS